MTVESSIKSRALRVGIRLASSAAGGVALAAAWLSCMDFLWRVGLLRSGPCVSGELVFYLFLTVPCFIAGCFLGDRVSRNALRPKG